MIPIAFQTTNIHTIGVLESPQLLVIGTFRVDVVKIQMPNAAEYYYGAGISRTPCYGVRRPWASYLLVK